MDETNEDEFASARTTNNTTKASSESETLNNSHNHHIIRETNEDEFASARIIKNTTKPSSESETLNNSQNHLIIGETNEDEFASGRTTKNITKASSKSGASSENFDTLADSEKFETLKDDKTTEQNTLDQQLYVMQLIHTEGCFESPIDISIHTSKEIWLPPLQWINFDRKPKKIKVTNTGLTVILSARWKRDRPFIQGGPFIDSKYVFSSWHLHWGQNSTEGSEHTIDGVRYPMEMHVVTCKGTYITQEAALNEEDGCATLVYIFQIQGSPNPDLQPIVDALNDIRQPGSSKHFKPGLIKNVVRRFTDDYYMYWGAVSTPKCSHTILWMISRIPIGVSKEQLDAFRSILDYQGKYLDSNFRSVQDSQNRTVFHVSPSSSKKTTLILNSSS